MSDNIKLLSERVNIRTVVIALVTAVFGVLLLYFSANNSLWVGYEIWQIVIRDLGGFLLVTVALTLFWEIMGKRAFMDEILAKAQISNEIKYAGITKVCDSIRDIEWKSYLKNVKELDIFFPYGRTWRNTYLQELKEVASRVDARIRVVLPDPDDELTINELSRRFKYTPEKLKELIIEVDSYFRMLLPLNKKGADINIWYLPAAPTFSTYRIDQKTVLVLYTHRKERVPVPTFVCEMGGSLDNFIRKEFETMISDGGLARLVTKEGPSATSL